AAPGAEVRDEPNEPVAEHERRLPAERAATGPQLGRDERDARVPDVVQHLTRSGPRLGGPAAARGRPDRRDLSTTRRAYRQASEFERTRGQDAACVLVLTERPNPATIVSRTR